MIVTTLSAFPCRINLNVKIIALRSIDYFSSSCMPVIKAIKVEQIWSEVVNVCGPNYSSRYPFVADSFEFPSANFFGENSDCRCRTRWRQRWIMVRHRLVCFTMKQRKILMSQMESYQTVWKKDRKWRGAGGRTHSFPASQSMRFYLVLRRCVGASLSPGPILCLSLTRYYQPFSFLPLIRSCQEYANESFWNLSA